MTRTAISVRRTPSRTGAHDIGNYLEKRERVEQFEATVEAGHAWDPTAREALLRILRGKLESPNL